MRFSRGLNVEGGPAQTARNHGSGSRIRCRSLSWIDVPRRRMTNGESRTLDVERRIGAARYSFCCRTPPRNRIRSAEPFGRPDMGVHDWTRVDAGIFHDFHTTWVGQFRTALNSGLLPGNYYALAEQH